MMTAAWFVRGTVAALVLAAAGWVLLQRHESAQARERGAALHEGRAAVPGLLVGLETALPTLATRCVNCHEGAAALGGVLDARRLTEPQPRRGGPATRYDLAAFCQLLRTGIDPAQVIIDTSMPASTSLNINARTYGLSSRRAERTPALCVGRCARADGRRARC